MGERLRILSLDIDFLSFQDSLNQISEWGLQHQQGFICFANAHMIIEAHHDPLFQDVLRSARLILADGKPIAASFHLLYGKKQERIAGMDFMPALLEMANTSHAKIFLYGSTETVLAKLANKINIEYPGVVLAGMISPPFRMLTSEESADHVAAMNASGAQFVLLALGCPKQEKWMANHFHSVNAILLGLGGAFPVVAGIQKRCPKWMRNAGLEWLYRLLQEPRRLIKRYIVTNSVFIFLLTKEFLKKKEKIN